MSDSGTYKIQRRLPLYRVGRVAMVPVMKAFSGYRITGKANVPRRGPVILAGTHRSYLDIPFLAASTWRVVHFMGKADLWDGGFSKWFCTQTGAFPVRRGMRDRQSLENGLSVLAEGGAMGIFPEGKRKDGPVVEDLHGGCIYLAQKGGAPIVPVAICGTGNLMGGDARLHPFRRVLVDVGEPMSVPADVGYRGRQEYLEMLGSELQEMYSALRRRLGEPTIDDVDTSTASPDSSQDERGSAAS